MKCVVFAYCNMGCAGIKSLLKHGFEIQAVFTHKDSPTENIWYDSVAETAAANGIPVFAPENVNHPLWIEKIKKMQPDFIFSFYYRNMLKKEILDIPAKGAFNLHGSLLPKYRGRCPINWVILNGEKETGVTLHKMTPRPDDGDIVAQSKITIANDDTGKTLFAKSVTAAEQLLDAALPTLKNGTAKFTPQDNSKATYFGGRKPADGEINWNKSADEVRNLIRAVTRPYPGAFSFLGERKCFFWDVTVVAGEGKAGKVLSKHPLTIACGSGAIQVNFAQLDNGIYSSGEQFATEARVEVNMTFGPTCAKPPKRPAGRRYSFLASMGSSAAP